MAHTIPLHLDMELIVQLTLGGQSTKIVDWITGQHVEDLVYKIVINPDGTGKAYMFKPNAEGQFYKVGDGHARYHRSFPIVKIYGQMFGRR